MAVWKLQKLGRVSSATGEPFPPDVEIVTALFGDEEETGEDKVRGAGFLRRDYLAEEATEERLEGAFCVWRTRTPPAKTEEERRFDLGMAREFLERLLNEKNPEREAVCMTLALLLARKRRLVIVEQAEASIKVRWPRETKLFDIPAPQVTDADAEVLQRDLMKLFGMEIEEPTEEPPADPPSGTEQNE